MSDRETLIEFLETDLGVDMDDVEDNEPLFSSGLVDSFALVTLMMHLENSGGFRINPADVTLDNLDTVERILAYMARVRT